MREGLAPTPVPAMAGVDIDWAHLDSEGKSHDQAAVVCARAMVARYVSSAAKTSAASMQSAGAGVDNSSALPVAHQWRRCRP